MISGGHATIFVSNMDRAVQFYTETLGMKLTNRFGDNWATVDAGPGLTIGLHPASARYPAPGTRGSMVLGVMIDEPIDTVIARLSAKGVKFNSSVVRDQIGAFVQLEDPDGNAMYFWDEDGAIDEEEAAEPVATKA
jgi:catechol 2,3-dioxygenase-like lactoylglutathione lyase family enzyme